MDKYYFIRGYDVYIEDDIIVFSDYVINVTNMIADFKRL